MLRSSEILKIRDAAVQAAHASGRVLTKYYGKKLKIGEKPGAGLVTNADIEAESSAIRVLKKKFPDFGILTEESPPIGSTTAEGRWIMDPLDGTTNFVHGFPMFCVSIAAEWRGEIIIGCIYHPILRDLYVAVRGKGATLNGKQIRVSQTTRLENSLLTTGFSYRKDELLHSEMGAFERLSQVVQAVRRPGSAALDLAYTARGVFDGFWERRLAPWDVAAGSLLVQEAGGKVTDFKGNSFRLPSSEILASNLALHPKLSQEIKSGMHLV